MLSAQDPTRILGFLLLAMVSLTAGFTTVSWAQEDKAPLEPLASIGPNMDAATVDLEHGETLEVHVHTDGPQAAFAIFDPEDELREHAHLEPGEHASVRADMDGSWIVMPTSGDEAQAALVINTDDADASMDRVGSIPVEAHTRVLTEQDGGALDEQRLVGIERAPAMVHLRVNGQADAFDARVTSPEGVVFEGGAASVNESQPLTLGGNMTLDPSRIEAGLFQVDARAEAFDGSLELVHTSYVREEALLDLVQEPVPGLAEAGIPVAALTGGEGVHVTVAESGRIVFAVEPGGGATVRVYDGSHDVRAIVDLGEEEEGFDWDFEEDQARVETRAVNAPEGSSLTVYASTVDPGDDDEGRVYVLEPGERTASPAMPTRFEDTRFTFEGGVAPTTNTHSAEARLPGGLVGVSLDVDAVAGWQHSIRVVGPLGLIYEHVREGTVAGEGVEQRTRANPSHYGDGDFTVRLTESSTVESQVQVTLTHYVPP